MAFENIGVRAVIEGIGAFNRDADAINRRLKEVTGNIEGIAPATKKASLGLRDIEGDLTKTGLALAAVGGAGIALIASSTRLAARVETLGVVTAVLGRNVGKTEPEIRALEKSIQGLGITIQGSRQAIAKMIGSNVDLAHATDLARLAQNAAVIAGINSTEAFERLVDVITSGNVLMARNLGLQVSFERAYQATANSLGKTTAELTELDKVQARTTAVLAAGVNIAGAYEEAMTTVGKAVTSLDRHLEDSRVVLGQAWLPVYAEAVALITASLVKWKDLDAVSQDLSSTFFGATSITIALGGALALAAAKLPGLIAAFGSVGAAVGLSAGAFAILVIAIAAVITAGVKLLAFIRDTKEQSRKLKEELSDFHRQLLVGSDNYDEYRREADRVNQVIRDQGVLGRVLTKEIEVLSREEFEAAQAAAQLEDKQSGATSAMSDADAAAADAAGSFEDMAAAEAEAARKAEELAEKQEILKGKLSEIQLQISTDITPQFGDFKDQLADLNDQIAGLEAEKVEAIAELELAGLEEADEATENFADLKEELKDAKQRLQELQVELGIAALREDVLSERTSEATDAASEANKEISEASRLQAEASRLQAESRIDRLTADIADQKQVISELSAEIKTAGSATEDIATSQQEKLAELEAEYAEKQASIRDQLDETTKAWERQTKEIIFNLATQRFGLDGFTDEELDALTTLAGPEGLGLIDEAGVALLEKIDLLNAGMTATGDQSGLFAEDMATLARVMADPKQSAEELAAAIRDINSALIESLPPSSQALLTLLFGGGIPFGGAPPSGAAANVGGFGGAKQFGGPVGRGRPVRVGERGEELFIPRSSGEIVSNRLLSVLNSLASALPIAAPSMAMASAGGSTTNNEFRQTINTSAPVEPIAADFRLMALMGERRG